MDKDQIVGSAKEIKGSAKKTIGKVTGDAKLQSGGEAEKIEGKVQNAFGGFKDALTKSRLQAPLNPTATPSLRFGQLGASRRRSSATLENAFFKGISRLRAVPAQSGPDEKGFDNLNGEGGGDFLSNHLCRFRR